MRIVRHLPIALWLLCAALTLPTARQRGFVLHPRPVSYGEAAVAITVTWIVLALEAAVLHAMLRTYPPRWAWVRLLACIAGAALLWLGVMQWSTTDLGPGYIYTIGLLPIMASVALTIIGLSRSMAWFWRRRLKKRLRTSGGA
jgi:hypothetical protein